jgi:hypothetical protein
LGQPGGNRARHIQEKDSRRDADCPRIYSLSEYIRNFVTIQAR